MALTARSGLAPGERLAQEDGAGDRSKDRREELQDRCVGEREVLQRVVQAEDADEAGRRAGSTVVTSYGRKVGGSTYPKHPRRTRRRRTSLGPRIGSGTLVMVLWTR